MKKNSKAYKTIGEVAEILELDSVGNKTNTHTIRYWESEFKQIKPIMINKRRHYDDKNINVLNVLSQIAQKMGDVDTTINSLKKILLIDNSNIECISKIYKLLLTKSLLDEALENINLILKIDKDHYYAMRDKAYIYFLKNSFFDNRCYELILIILLAETVSW